MSNENTKIEAIINDENKVAELTAKLEWLIEHGVILDWAKFYYFDLGWHILPGYAGQKHSYLKWITELNCRNKRVSWEILEKEFAKPTTKIILLVTGKISNVTVVDKDLYKEVNPKAQYILESLLSTVCSVSGGSGEHAFYEYAGGDADIIGVEGCIDIRNHDLIVLPPSIHKSGQNYEWKDLPILPFPKFQRELFEEYENKEIVAGDENQRRILGIEIKDGKLEEITSYRNNSLHYVTLRISATFPNDRDLAWSIYYAFAKEHCPTLPEKEIISIFNSAFNSKIVNEARLDALEETEKTEIDISKYGDPPVIFWNQLNDFKFPETSWLLKDLIIERGINYFYGKPGVCKTWLAQYLAICIARGVCAFNNHAFVTKKVKILFVDKDNDSYQMVLRVVSLGGLDIDQIAYYFDSSSFRVDKEESVIKLLNCIKQHNFGLVVFDTSRDIHKGEEDNSTEMSKVNQFFKRVIRAGAGVLAISHTKKQDEKDPIDKLRGSTAISGSAASMILVEQPDENTITLQMGKSRYAPKIKPITLKILKDLNSITGFEYAGEYVEKEKSEQPRTSNRTTKETAQGVIISKLINDKLVGVDGTLKASILDEAKVQKLNLRTVEDELQALVRDKKVSSKKEGDNWLYSLVQDDPEPSSN